MVIFDLVGITTFKQDVSIMPTTVQLKQKLDTRYVCFSEISGRRAGHRELMTREGRIRYYFPAPSKRRNSIRFKLTRHFRAVISESFVSSSSVEAASDASIARDEGSI